MTASTDNNPYAAPSPSESADAPEGFGYPPAPPVENHGRGFTIASFVLAAISLLFAPIILGPIGAVLGFVGHSKGDRVGKWAGITSIVCTVIGLVLAAVVIKNLRH
jgi:hypothetical protein